jgi:hypothetical protein
MSHETNDASAEGTAEELHRQDPTLFQARPEGLAQPRYSSKPTSLNSPHDSALRANPFPEVTDLICRLPLPTLFYRLEAVHLGDLLRIWVRSGMVFKSSSDFQGQTKAHRTSQEP